MLVSPRSCMAQIPLDIGPRHHRARGGQDLPSLARLLAEARPGDRVKWRLDMHEVQEQGVVQVVGQLQEKGGGGYVIASMLLEKVDSTTLLSHQERMLFRDGVLPQAGRGGCWGLWGA